MSTPKSPPSLFGALSIELLEQIFLFTSPQTVLRLSLVNRTCHKLVRESPSIQYEIDLFAVGLRRNPRFEAPIPNCRAALEAYRTHLQNLDPVETWNEPIHGHDWTPDIIAVSGVHGLRQEGCVKFFVFGPTSQGVPRREWEIPLKDVEFRTFTFYPQANVLAIAGNENELAPCEWKIQLRTLNDGEPHPSAQTPVLSYTLELDTGHHSDDWQMSITSSRLAFLRLFTDIFTPAVQLMIVWDWTTGEVLLDLKNQTYLSVAFIDDSWLVLLRGDSTPTGVVFLDTKQMTTDGGELAQTTFYFDPSKPEGSALLDFASDLGVYGPSGGDDLFVPFYPDISQRVLVVVVMSCSDFLVIKTEALLRLAQERKGEDLQWGEWRVYATRVSRDRRETMALWVSGPLVFSMTRTQSGQTSIEVYDFSARAYARYMKTIEDGMAEEFEPWITHVLPWWQIDVIISYGCYNSITFVLDSDDPLAGTMRVWNFV